MDEKEYDEMWRKVLSRARITWDGPKYLEVGDIVDIALTYYKVIEVEKTYLVEGVHITEALCEIIPPPGKRVKVIRKK
jgi:hypothetical protein